MISKRIQKYREELAPLSIVELVEESIAEGLQPGMQVYASKDSTVIANFGRGSAGSSGEMTHHTIVPWLSATKPIVASAVGYQFENKSFSLDEPVATEIPDFEQGGKSQVTARHLLTHTAPFAYDLEPRIAVGPWEQATEAVKRIPLRSRAVLGKTACYTSLAGWHVLGELLTRISQESLSNIIRSKIFQPLGMSDCWLGVPEHSMSEVSRRQAELFDTSKGRRVRYPGFNQNTFRAATIPGMGALGPMSQLGLFYEALLDDTCQTIGLSTATTHLFTSTARQLLWDEKYGGKINWGLGFITDRRFLSGPRVEGPVFGHDGRRSSLAFADRDRRVVVCIMANGLCKTVANRIRMRKLVDMIFDEAGIPKLARLSDTNQQL